MRCHQAEETRTDVMESDGKGLEQDHQPGAVLRQGCGLETEIEFRVVLRHSWHLLALYFRRKAFSLFTTGGGSEE